MELEQIAKNIDKKENGIYFSKTVSNISYPKDGNVNFMQIEQDSFWFNHRNNVIIESVKKYNPYKTFFDIGGGNGFVSKGLQDAGVEVVLIEPGPVGAINAKRRNIKNVVCATLQDAAFKKSSLDVVGLFDVVEHIENDAVFLGDVYKYMKPDGYIYITVPAFNTLWSNEDTEAGHYRRYSLNQIKELLMQSGFSIVYATYIFSILPIPIFISRTIPSKLKTNQKSDSFLKHKKDHLRKKGVLNKMVQNIWNWELRKIKKSEKIHFGSSCFIIGKKD